MVGWTSVFANVPGRYRLNPVLGTVRMDAGRGGGGVCLSRRNLAVGLLFVMLSSVACGGQSPSISPTVTATTTPTTTPNPTPRPTPRPTPSPSPTPGPTVFGNLQVGFIPATDDVEDPKPPIDVSLVIKAVDGDAELTQPITDATGGFSLSLDPGTYGLQTLEILAPSMSDEAFELPMNGPTFTVPATGCVYIGRISFSYVRTPESSSPEKAGALIQEAAEAFDYDPNDVGFIFLASGSLVLPGYEAGVTLPEKGERVSGSEDCSVTLAKF